MSNKRGSVMLLLMFTLFHTTIALVQAQDPLPPPDNLWLQADTLYWNAVEGADLYFASRTHDQSEVITSVGDSRTQQNYTDLQDGVEYEFKVRAADSSNRSRDGGWSETIRATFRDGYCVETNDGSYIRFPSSGFLIGITTQYDDASCDDPRGRYPILRANGLAYTTRGFSVSSDICGMGNDGDGLSNALVSNGGKYDHI